MEYMPSELEDHKLGGLNNRSLLCHSSGDQESKIKMSAVLALSEGCGGESVLCTTPSSGGLLAI